MLAEHPHGRLHARPHLGGPALPVSVSPRRRRVHAGRVPGRAAGVALASLALSLSALGAAPAAAAPRVVPTAVARLRSGDLRALAAEVRLALQALRAASPGLTPSGRARLGRTYDARAYRVVAPRPPGARGPSPSSPRGPGPLSVPSLLGSVCRAWGRPSPDDFVFYERFPALGAAGDEAAPVRLAAALGPHDPDVPHDPRAMGPPELLPPAEHAARAQLVAAVLAGARARPDLVLLGLQCGWADAVGSLAHGVVVLDPRSEELLWVYRDERWAD